MIKAASDAPVIDLIPAMVDGLDGLVAALKERLPQPILIAPLPWKLSRRERQVCMLLADANAARHDNKSMAFTMVPPITEGTMKCYVSRLRIKTGLDRIGLALLGLAVKFHEENARRLEAWSLANRGRSNSCR